MKHNLNFKMFVAALALIFSVFQAQAQSALDAKGTQAPEPASTGSGTAAMDYQPAPAAFLTSKVIKGDALELSFNVMGMNEKFVRTLRNPSENGLSIASFDHIFSSLEVDQANQRVTLVCRNKNLSEENVLSILNMVLQQTVQPAVSK